MNVRCAILGFDLRCRAGYFAAVLGETGSAMKDSSSGLYVDRDGTPFRHILSWMRSGRLVRSSDTSYDYYARGLLQQCFPIFE